MEQDLSTEDILRQYLLGQLAEDVQERVEQRLMTEAWFSERLSAIEADLVDDYTAGRLTDAEKRSFENLFLAYPGRRREVEFASALQRYAASASAGRVAPAGRAGSWSGFFDFIRSQSLSFKTALVAGGVALLLGGGWLILEVTRLQQQLSVSVAQQAATEKERGRLARELESERGRRSRIEQELAASKLPRQPETPETHEPKVRTNFIAMTLLPGLVRDSGSLPRVVLPPGKDFARLELLLESDNYQKFDAVLQTAEGTGVWRQAGLRATKAPDGSAVVVQVPRGVLKPQDYALRLSGVSPDGTPEAVGTYYFRVSER